MSAFITKTHFIHFNNRVGFNHALCNRRPNFRCAPTPVLVSLTTEEVKPADESKIAPQSRLEIPSAPATTPSIQEGQGKPENTLQSPARKELNPPPSKFQAEPGVTYYTSCGACSAVYEIDPTDIGNGRKVSCSVCDNQWFQKPERLSKLAEGQSFKDYPLAEKDEYIRKNKEKRGTRQPRSFDDGNFRRNNSERRGGRRDRPRQGYSLFIGNLPFSVTDEEVGNFISAVIKPKSVAIIRDPEGNSKGYAFANVESQDEVDQAVEALDGNMLLGRNVAVKPGRRNQ